MTTTDSDGPWPIDVDKLRKSAIKLEAVANRLSEDNPSVKDWYGHFKDLVEDAKAGNITETLDELPKGGNAFMYGNLEKLSELESAYAAFWGILAFGEWEANKRLEQRMLEMKKELFGEASNKDP